MIAVLLVAGCASTTPETAGPPQGASRDDAAAAGSGSGSADGCRGPGRYESGKEGSYRPCCAGLKEVFYGKPSYTGDGTVKTCDHPPLRVYACVRGECGDGMCEAGEAPSCGCVQDCPQAAWGAADAGVASDAGSGQASRCARAASCSGSSSFCRRAQLESRVAACVNRPLTPYYAVRCGAYDGIVAQGTDNATYYYYDATGKLVGRNDVGLAPRGCVSYDPSFELPAACEIVTPECVEDAGS